MASTPFPRPLNFTQTLHRTLYPAIDPSGALKGVAQGKKALVTGAGRGIGKAIALSLAQSGASVLILTSRTLSQLVQVETEIRAAIKETASSENPIRVINQETDVTDEKSVLKLFERLKEENVGRLDLLVNNAGYLETVVPFAERDWNEFQLSIDANIKGTSLPTLLFLRHNLSLLPNQSSFPSPPTLSPLQSQPTANQYHQAFNEVTIVCTSSIGSMLTRPGFHAYQPAKGWVNRFVEFLHAEYSLSTPSGLRAFVYHPGSVLTELATNMPKETHSTVLIDSPDLAGGFVVWLIKKKKNENENEKSEEQEYEADFLRGKYISCNWDVEELVRRKNEILKDDQMLMTRVNFGGIGI